MGTASQRSVFDDGLPTFRGLKQSPASISFEIAAGWRQFEAEYVLTNPVLPEAPLPDAELSNSEREEFLDDKEQCSDSRLIFGFQVPKGFRFEESLILVVSAAQCRRTLQPWGQSQGPVVHAAYCPHDGQSADESFWKACRRLRHTVADDVRVVEKNTCSWWVYSPKPLDHDTDLSLKFCVKLDASMQSACANAQVP